MIYLFLKITWQLNKSMYSLTLKDAPISANDHFKKNKLSGREEALGERRERK